MTQKELTNILQRMVLNRDHKKALERKINHLKNRIKIHKGNPSFDKAELSSLLQCKANSELAENIIKEMENNAPTI